MDELTVTDREARLLRAYLRTDSIPRAARECGFSVGAARRLIYSRDVQKFIKQVAVELRARYEITVENVANELAKIAFMNVGRLMIEQADGSQVIDLANLDSGDAAAISEFQIDTYMDGRGDDARQVKSLKVKFAPKTPALQLLGNHLKMFTEQHAITMNESIDERMRRGRLASMPAEEQLLLTSTHSAPPS